MMVPGLKGSPSAELGRKSSSLGGEGGPISSITSHKRTNRDLGRKKRQVARAISTESMREHCQILGCVAKLSEFSHSYHWGGAKDEKRGTKRSTAGRKTSGHSSEGKSYEAAKKLYLL